MLGPSRPLLLQLGWLHRTLLSADNSSDDIQFCVCSCMLHAQPLRLPVKRYKRLVFGRYKQEFSGLMLLPT